MIEAPEAPHHHHKATGIPWFDLVVPIAIICISVASLLTSLQSERSMRALVQQNSRLVSAQSTPLLTLESSNADDQGHPILNMTIANVGTGPAQIAWFRAIDSDGNDFSGKEVELRVLKVDPKQILTTQPINSSLLRSGAERLVFGWPRPVTNPAALAVWDKLNQARFHLRASACYCSMFDECRITEFGSSRPRPVQSCARDQTNQNP